MPRKSARGAGMIRLRSDGRWESRVTIGRDPLTGKQITKSFYGATQAEVRKKLTEAARDLDAGEYADAGALTLGRWLDIWYETYATAAVKETTLRSYADHKRTQALLHASAVSRGEPWEDTGAVFTNDRGGWLEGSAVYRNLQKHLRHIGIDDVRLHDLRHTFSKMTLSNGTDVKTLQETLGHSDPGFTLRVYGHADERMKREAARRIDQIAESLRSKAE